MPGVLIRTDWSRRKLAEAFLNIGAGGAAHTPGPDAECVEFLAKERDILGVGAETVGIDAQGRRIPNSIARCRATRSCTARIASVSRASPIWIGFHPAVPCHHAALKIVNGSGSPLRVLALAPA